MAIIAGLLAGTLGRWLGLRYRFQVAGLINLLLADSGYGLSNPPE